MNKSIKLLIITLLFCFSGIVQSASNDLHKAVEDNEIKKIEEILKKNPILLKDFDEKGNTPIHQAILENKSAALQSFMEYKKYINIQITNANGETPLVYAIKQNNYNAIIFILDNGINPFYKDQSGKNSLDYVKIFGDITTKKIYNEYYLINKDKIKKLQENYKSPLDLSLFKDSEKNEVKKDPNNKTTTVQDLLIANKNKKFGEIASAEPEALEEDIIESEPVVEIKELKELQNKVENLKIEKELVTNLQDQISLLKDENDGLKKRLQFKENTGLEYLTPTEESIVSSPYAGIYEQQVMFEENLDEININLMEQYTVIEDDSLENQHIDSIIEKSKNYEENKNDNLKKIEEDLIQGEESVKINIQKDNDKNKHLEMLPVNVNPNNKVNVTAVIETKTDTMVKEVQVIEEKKVVNEEKEIAKVSIAKSSEPIIIIKKEDNKPTIKVEIQKDSLLKLSKDKILILTILFLLLFIITIILSFIFLKDNKKNKDKK